MLRTYSDAAYTRISNGAARKHVKARARL